MDGRMDGQTELRWLRHAKAVAAVVRNNTRANVYFAIIMAQPVHLSNEHIVPDDH